MSAWRDPLMIAVEDNDCEKVKELIEIGHPADGSLVEEYTPIHLAVIQNNQECCNILLRSGARVNQVDSYGCTPLHRAALEATSIEVFKLLISFGADVNAKTASNITVLHLTAERGQLDKMKYLLNQSNIMVNVTNKLGKNILHSLVHDDVTDSVAMTTLVTSLVQKGISLNAQDIEGKTVLDYSTCDFIEVLVNLGADLTMQDKKGDDYINRHMIRGLDFSTDPFLQKFLKGKLKSLSKKDVSMHVNSAGSGGQTPFLRACFTASATDLEMFLDAGADILSADNLNRNPLHLMSRELWIQDKQCVCVLLDRGAEINKKDIFGRTPLFKIYLPEIVDIFLAHNVDLSSTDRCGRTPLVALMEYGDTEILNALIKHGADTNAKDKFGSSPLHYAVWHNNEEILKLILENGGDITVLDGNGYSPKELAIQLGNESALSLLEAHSSKIRIKNEDIEVLYDRTNFGVANDKDGNLPNNNVMRSRPLPLIDYFHDNKISILEHVSAPIDFDKFAKNVFQAPGIGKIVFKEASEINQKIVNMVKRICLKIQEKDGRFASTVVQTGSMAEGSKCGYPEEFDFVSCLDEFAEISEIVEDESTSKFGFAKLLLRDEGARKSFDIFFNDNDNLNVQQVLDTFMALTLEVILDADIWINDEIFFNGDIKNIVEKPVINMGVTWVGCIYKHLNVSVDIVPAIRKRGWWPKQSNLTSLPFFTEAVRIEGCMLLAQSGPEEYRTSDQLRVSFAPAEIAYFTNLPSVLRDSYVLAKAMRNECVCPPIHLDGSYTNLQAESAISSYMLKTCLFHAVKRCLHNTPFCEDDKRKQGRYLARTWAVLIYDTLKDYVQQSNLPAFFLATHNVFTFSDTFMTNLSAEKVQELALRNNNRRKIFLECIRKKLGC